MSSIEAYLVRRFVSKHVSFAVLRGRRTARITSQWATDCATRGTILALRLQCFARCKCLIEIRGHCADGIAKKKERSTTLATRQILPKVEPTVMRLNGKGLMTEARDYVNLKINPTF